MKVEPIDTPAAGTWARDCELISLYYDDKGFRISYRREEDDTYWSMKCDGITAYKVISEELSRKGYLINLPFEGAFFEIFDSPWIDELGGGGSRILNQSRHYVLKFYDETVELIAQKLIFEQLKEKPENSPY